MIRMLEVFIMFFMGIAYPAFSQTIIPLYRGAIPNSLPRPDERQNTLNAKGEIYLTKISIPELTICFPSKGKANGTAIIICPGGGYGGISYTLEGTTVATELNRMGILAVILTYRLPNDLTMIDKAAGPLQDALQAIKTVRLHATAWGICPHKIGIAGFSAGGYLAVMAATHYQNSFLDKSDSISLRPDFMILVYPVISMTYSLTHLFTREHLLGKSPSAERIRFYSAECQVTSSTPPTFIVHAGNDSTVKVANSIGLYQALQHWGVPAEMFIYPGGGHGFGLNNITSVDRWINRCRDWMISNNWLPPNK
jgi:acetyl esterase/lipase